LPLFSHPWRIVFVVVSGSLFLFVWNYTIAVATSAVFWWIYASLVVQFPRINYVVHTTDWCAVLLNKRGSGN